MRIIGVNGSPRKTWNTAMILGSVLEGAASKGAGTELVHLYDLDFKGCVSCFACKAKGGKSYGRCGYRDGLTPLLEAIADADALVLGSPIYLSDVTGAMRSFVERLVFQYLVYDGAYSAIAPKKIPVAVAYTMNISEARLTEWGYDRMFSAFEGPLKRTFGSVESLAVTDTLQFDDYSRYVATAFDEGAKQERRRTVFPSDCEKARQMGVRLAEAAEVLRR